MALSYVEQVGVDSTTDEEMTVSPGEECSGKLRPTSLKTE